MANLVASIRASGPEPDIREAIENLRSWLEAHGLTGEVHFKYVVETEFREHIVASGEGDEQPCETLEDDIFREDMFSPPVVNDATPGFDLETSLKEFLLEVPLRESSSLPSRSYQQLRRNRIDTVGQLIEQTKYDLQAITGFGQGCLTYVEERLGEVGLSLKPSDY